MKAWKYQLFFWKYRLESWLKKWQKATGIFYIGGSDVFPPPLKPDEEALLLEQLGGEDDLQVKSVLIERNLRLVVYIARKFENTGINVEDLISIGTIGLIKAINTFKTDKNIKLATYASRCIENEILMQIRKTTKIKNDISLDKPLCEDYDGNQLVLSDIIPCEEDLDTKTIDEPADKQLIYQLISKLNEREREIMVLRYGLMGQQELTQREVAIKLGISQSYISRLEKRILNDMKIEMIKKMSV